MRDGNFRLRNPVLAFAISCSVGLLVAQPAFAESELDVLKRELAEQKQRLVEQQTLIEKLVLARIDEIDKKFT